MTSEAVDVKKEMSPAKAEEAQETSSAGFFATAVPEAPVPSSLDDGNGFQADYEEDRFDNPPSDVIEISDSEDDEVEEGSAC